MKRSEMVKHAEERASNEYDWGYGNDVDTYGAADFYLKVFQEAGMLAPSNKYFVEYNNKSMLRGIQEFHKQHQWELEDD